ncbi:hypothetical protein [Cryobacterium arcticum]|uniref:Uncharacterized protein n=1 Tax=Cryobacterium arcticum TaxID=670052 RepID=A0A1B1BLX7_9MICO|nr:hypothetical protein [Cryobacterium arcticum]ANP73538.1 hypothetical protein PA27867_2594 [Cryobacterium arcticum]
MRPFRFVSAAARPLFDLAESTVLEMFVDTLRITTLEICSERQLSASSWQPLADAFYFHVGYNLDYPVIPQPTLKEMLRSTKIQNVRRTNAAELDAPHRRYIPDLVHNYQLAVSTDSPMLAFLSFYHVAEHWFDEVIQNDIAAKLQSVISSPDFSYKRMKDLRKLIRMVSREIQTRNDELVINEMTALHLTLKLYLDLIDLRAVLDSFDDTLVEHYSHSDVSFSKGDVFDLGSNNHEAVLLALTKRIYKTRNALVHRKNGDRSRFVPFKDDKALEPEVILMRFIAEQIIIKSGTVA